MTDQYRGNLEVLHTTDWHLGFLHKLHPKPTSVLMKPIQDVFEYALKHSIRHVIVSGDVTNTPVMAPDVQRALIRLLNHYDGKLNVHIIPGNHCYHSDNVYSLMVFREIDVLWETINVYTQPEQIEIDGMIVNFLPFPHKEPLPSDRPAVNVTHLTPAGAKMDNGYPAKKGTTMLPMDTGDYYLNGHLHLEQTGDNYHCCGTLYPVRFGETGNKGFSRVRLRENVTGGYVEAEIKRIPVKPALRFERMTVTRESDFQLLENDPNLFYDLTVEPGVPVPHRMLRGYQNILKMTASRAAVKMEDQQVLSVGLTQLQLDDAALLEAFLTNAKLAPSVHARALELDSEVALLTKGQIATAKSLANAVEIEEAA